MKMQDEERWVNDALTGSHSAFQRLYDAYRKPMLRFTMSQINDLDAALDIVQASFVIAWRDMHRLRNPKRFGAWLIRIASNLTNRWLRNQYRRRLETSTDDSVAIQTYRRDELRQEVWDAIDVLPPRERESVVLHYIIGYTYDEVANLLHVPESTVLGRLQRARNRLREEFQDMVKQLRLELDATVYDVLQKQAERENTTTDSMATRILAKYATTRSLDTDNKTFDSDRIPVVADLDVEPARTLVRRFFEALAACRYTEASTLSSPNYDDTDWSKSGLVSVAGVLDIGEPYQKPDRRYAAGCGVFVPYAVAMYDGSVRRFRAAVRCDNPNREWRLDGGI